MNNKEIRTELKKIHGVVKKLPEKRILGGKKNPLLKESAIFNLGTLDRLVSHEDHWRNLAHLDRHLEVEFSAPDISVQFGNMHE